MGFLVATAVVPVQAQNGAGGRYSTIKLDGGIVIPDPPPGQDERLIPISWTNVVILVNENSPASIEVAKMYREFYPGITEEQVLYLTGLPDSASLTAGPADEIITRTQFESLIAEPLRDHLVNMGIVDSTYVIITTAGMPYRIEDTNAAYANVISPAASDATLTTNNRNAVNAASVESELAVLWQIDPDPAFTTGRLSINSRVVNPYQGYRSSMKRWAGGRNIITRRSTFKWQTMWLVAKGPFIEGDRDNAGYSAINRRMNPMDIYLVSRLDGPRASGQYPVFSVRKMLERSAAVSNPRYRGFVGYASSKGVVVIDHTPMPPAGGNLAATNIYNFPPVVDHLDQPLFPTPPGADYPGAPATWSQADHYARLYLWLTGLVAPTATTVQTATTFGFGGKVLWDYTAAWPSSAAFPAGAGAVALLTGGRNSNDGRPATYLTTGGPNGGPLVTCVPGAIFASVESFNAVTFFTSTSTSQAKIAEFIGIGGSGAIGHAFEPELGATVQGDFVVENLMRDDDHNGLGDLCWAEAAFSGVPYLSWSEVVIGDPLMRLRTGPGAIVSLDARPGDVDGDNTVSYNDMFVLLGSYGATIGQPAYYVPADLTQDGVVDGEDLTLVLTNYGVTY